MIWVTHLAAFLLGVGATGLALRWILMRTGTPEFAIGLRASNFKEFANRLKLRVAAGDDVIEAIDAIQGGARKDLTDLAKPEGDS